MTFGKMRPEGGVSLRTALMSMIGLAAIISVVMVVLTRMVSKAGAELSKTLEGYIEMRAEAYDMMDASDYLTEKVQHFVLRADQESMDAYFGEVQSSQRREHAIEALSGRPEVKEAYKDLLKAFEYSNELMDRELYAMRLVVSGIGYYYSSPALDKVSLSVEDAELSPQAKVAKAHAMVLDEDYFDLKGQVRQNVQAAITALDNLIYRTQTAAANTLSRDMRTIRLLYFLFFLLILAIILNWIHLGMKPILRAVASIRADKPITLTGYREFRQLAAAYNEMYASTRQTMSELQFEASHDELTGLYNRVTHADLLQSINLSSTILLIVDLDKFKNVNDTYGHDVGDRVLKKAAATLQRTFRSNDYICRIGGDEFVVYMHLTDFVGKVLLKQKIDFINQRLRDSADGLPPITVSVGAAWGSGAASGEELFLHADKALYRTKSHGRCGISFYDPSLDAPNQSA